MRSVICAIVKNEQLFIHEWVQWYLDHGFDCLYIYEDYDSNSHKKEVEDFINSNKVVLVNLDSANLPITKRGCLGGQSTQQQLYLWFLNQCKDGSIDADWVGFFDVDEFIDFEDGWDLNKLEEEYKDKGGVLLSWVMFGANGHIDRPDGNVVKNYTTHLPLGAYIESSPQWCVKSLVNVKNCDGMPNIHIFNGCEKTDGSDFKAPLCFEKAWLNHYFTKSWEDYLDRIFNRGNMQNNYRCLDTFFNVSLEFAENKQQMIEEQRYRHTAATMWISHEQYIISGGNSAKLAQLRDKIQYRYGR